MATTGRSRIRAAIALLVIVGFLVPAVTPWFDVVTLPTVETETLVRLAGLGIVVLVGFLLVRQKRRSRRQQASEDASEQASDRQVEGSGEVYAPYAYNNQHAAKREGERIQERAAEISEAERDRRR